MRLFLVTFPEVPGMNFRLSAVVVTKKRGSLKGLLLDAFSGHEPGLVEVRGLIGQNEFQAQEIDLRKEGVY